MIFIEFSPLIIKQRDIVGIPKCWSVSYGFQAKPRSTHPARHVFPIQVGWLGMSHDQPYQWPAGLRSLLQEPRVQPHLGNGKRRAFWAGVETASEVPEIKGLSSLPIEHVINWVTLLFYK